MKPKVQFVTFSIMALTIVTLLACTQEEMPKILALGLVNNGNELSVLDLNNSSRQYITNSQGITPTSFSYCDVKKEIAYSAFVENGEEIILWEINHNTYALTKEN